MAFKDYYDFIYLNSHLTRSQAQFVARYCWNKGMDKYEALRVAWDVKANMKIAKRNKAIKVIWHIATRMVEKSDFSRRWQNLIDRIACEYDVFVQQDIYEGRIAIEDDAVNFDPIEF